MFNTNLLKASQSNDILIAKTEWYEIYRVSHDDKKGLCLCTHKIKHVVYMYNKFTKKTISVGTTCCKKFKLQQHLLPNTILKNTLIHVLTKSNFFIKGEYGIITNIDDYMNAVKIQLISYIKSQYINNNNIHKLLELQQKINNLINEYNIEYLNSVYYELQDQIEDLKMWEQINNDWVEKKRLQKLHIENERLQKLHIENERLQKLQIENNRVENERLQKLQIENDRLINKFSEKTRLDNELLNNSRIKYNDDCLNEKYHVPNDLCILESHKDVTSLKKVGIYCNVCSQWKSRCRK